MGTFHGRSLALSFSLLVAGSIATRAEGPATKCGRDTFKIGIGSPIGDHDQWAPSPGCVDRTRIEPINNGDRNVIKVPIQGLFQSTYNVLVEFDGTRDADGFVRKLGAIQGSFELSVDRNFPWNDRSLTNVTIKARDVTVKANGQTTTAEALGAR